MRVVDTHLHLWQRTPGRYGWLDHPGLAAIDRTYAVAEARGALLGTPVQEVVLVQAENSTADTDDMLAAAARWPAVSGVVCWLPLEKQPALAAELDRLADHPRVVGCRHLNHDEPDPAWLARNTVHAGLRTVAERGLTYDVVAVTERHLRDAADLARDQPALTVVVDHLGSPPLAELGWQPWADALAAVAVCPNVVVKVSGLSTLGSASYRPETLRRYLDHARAHFGAARMMYGGDWPVSTLALPYASMWRVVNRATEHWSAEDRALLFGRTAEVTYGLNSAAP